MRSHEPFTDKFLVSLSDIIRLCRRYKYTILGSVLGMSLLGGVIALTSRVEYRVEGTFREKIPKQANFNTSFSSLITSSIGSSESEAIANLKSRKLMEAVISKMNLQGYLLQKPDRDTYIKRIKENILSEYAHNAKWLRPILKDPCCALKITSIKYEEEEPFSCEIRCQADKSYEVFDKKGNSLGRSQIGEPFEHEKFQFVLLQDENLPPSSDPYYLVLMPSKLVVTQLLANLDIDQDKNDKNLLKLSFKHRDRHFATQVVNTLMSCYQDYLNETHNRQAKIQLGYLEKRKEETKDTLVEMMEKHADLMTKGFSTSGIADTEKELQFLAERRHRIKEKLLSNKLEVKRLQNLQAGQCAFYETYNAMDGYPHIINTMLEKMRTLKQQRDFLELAISKSPLFDVKQFQESFKQQLQELNEIQQYRVELEQIIECCQKRIPIDRSLSLFRDPRFLVNSWHDKLFNTPTIGGERLKNLQDEYLSYLKNLERLLQVREKITRERLVHQQDPSLEFQGINMHAAEELYISYCKTMNELESDLRENNFLLVQLQDPNFEISSLSPVLEDPVSQEMIKQASQLLLNLKDLNNRSNREQGRLKEDLALQKNFLTLHLQQISQIISLKQKLYEEKIHILQNLMLELIHQQISLHEKSLHDHILTRLENLRQERILIEQQLSEMQEEMATLPQKWVSEQILKHHVDTNRLLVKEVANIVETKNITHNLELILSAPLDTAIAPILPKSPGLMLHAFFGGILGACLSIGYLLTRSLMRGVPASADNLKIYGQLIAGSLSRVEKIPSTDNLNHADLDTLRRLENYLTERSFKPVGQSALLIEGTGPDYASHLASLLKKKGLKTLILPLSFNQPATQEKGLLQYLEGSLEFPPIKHGKEWDFIEAGGFSRFSNELLGSVRFQELINQLRTQYDWILATTRSLPAEAETESLATFFPLLAVSVDQETLPQLEPYMQWQRHGEKKVIFILVH